MQFSFEELAKYVGPAGGVGLIWALTRLIAVVRKQNASNRQQHDDHVDAVVGRQQKWIEEQDGVIAGLKAEVNECNERYERLAGEFRTHRTKNDIDQLESNRKLSDLRRENDELRSEISWMKGVLALLPHTPGQGLPRPPDPE